MAQAVGAAALLWRRRYPLSVAALTTALNLLSPVESTLVAIYSVTVHCRDRARAAAAVALLFVTYYVGGLVWELNDRYGAPLALALATALGCYVTTRRRLVDALVDRAHRVERERHLLAEQAVNRERDRLGRQMHDVITHRVSLMVLQAGALEMTTADDDVRRQAEQLRQVGVVALTELNAVFASLGQAGEPAHGHGTEVPAAALSAAPATDPHLDPAVENLAAVIDLVERWRQAGVDVELTGCGEPADVDATAQRAVYRILAKAITNAAKHAPGSVVRAGTRYDAGGLRVEIHSTAGVRDEHPLRSTGRRSGLAGLSERMRLLGGTLEHGPAEDDGYRVTAWVPLRCGPRPGPR